MAEHDTKFEILATPQIDSFYQKHIDAALASLSSQAAALWAYLPAKIQVLVCLYSEPSSGRSIVLTDAADIYRPKYMLAPWPLWQQLAEIIVEHPSLHKAVKAYIDVHARENLPLFEGAAAMAVNSSDPLLLKCFRRDIAMCLEFLRDDGDSWVRMWGRGISAALSSNVIGIRGVDGKTGLRRRIAHREIVKKNTAARNFLYAAFDTLRIVEANCE